MYVVREHNTFSHQPDKDSRVGGESQSCDSSIMRVDSFQQLSLPDTPDVNFVIIAT